MVNQVYSSLQDYGVCTSLEGLWREVHRIQAETNAAFQNDQQSAFFALARSYQDILYTATAM